MRLFFSGISDYPFGVKAQMELVDEPGKKTIRQMIPEFPENKNPDPSTCIILKDRKDSRQILWKIPVGAIHESPAYRVAIRVEFCNPITPLMPKTLLSRPFVIIKNP